MLFSVGVYYIIDNELLAHFFTDFSFGYLAYGPWWHGWNTRVTDATLALISPFRIDIFFLFGAGMLCTAYLSGSSPLEQT